VTVAPGQQPVDGSSLVVEAVPVISDEEEGEEQEQEEEEGVVSSTTQGSSLRYVHIH
jgi:hypothetical protein